MLTANDLLNALIDGIRKGVIGADAPVLMPDGLATFVVLDPTMDTVFITDVNPNPTVEEKAIADY